MKLCMITYVTITKEEGVKFTSDKLGGLIDELAPSFEHIVFIASGTDPNDLSYYPNGHSVLTYEVQAKNVDIVESGLANSRLSPLRKLLIWAKRIIPYWQHIGRVDFVYIMMPGFSPFLAHLLCRLRGKPYCLYFGSDWQEIAAFQVNWTGVSKSIYQFYLWLSAKAERMAVYNSAFTIVHGKKVLEKFVDTGARLVETSPIVSITRADFFYRDDTCQKPIIRCLYVGSLIERKGVRYLIDSVAQLVLEGMKVELDLVGGGEADYIAQLKHQVATLDLISQVNFVGQVSDIDVLLQHYRLADLFVLPSQGEGFPRVIYEAMSQGVPVIASSIDTIGSMIKSGEQALLIHPRSAESISQAVQELGADTDLRRKLIRSGYVFAEEKLGQVSPAQQLIELVSQHSNSE